MTTRHRRALATSAALSALTLLVACGSGPGAASAEVASIGDGSTPTTDEGGGETSAADREEAMLEYADCMRDHGINMPDPQFSGGGDGGGGMIALEVDPESDEFQEAEAACQPLIEEAMGDLELDPEQEAEMREQLLEFAECMREHGIDMPDPVFDGDGRVTMRAEAGERFEPGVEDDEFAAASEECGRAGPGMVVNGGDAADAGEDG